MIDTIGPILIGCFLLVGALFALVGAIGLTRLPDPMTRLHAPTKVGTVGIGALLLASLLNRWVYGDGSYHETLVTAFLIVTAPVSAKFIAKVNIHTRACEETPKPPRDGNWSTLSEPISKSPQHSADD